MAQNDLFLCENNIRRLEQEVDAFRDAHCTRDTFCLNFKDFWKNLRLAGTPGLTTMCDQGFTRS